MLRIVWIAICLSTSMAYAMEESKASQIRELDTYDVSKNCAKGCEICCKTLSWASWSCGLCCWLLKCGGEAPKVTRHFINVSSAMGNAANYFKTQCGESKSLDIPYSPKPL